MMAQHSVEDRIRRKAHELWEAEGHPHGRDQDHWDRAKEIVADEERNAIGPQSDGDAPADAGSATPSGNDGEPAVKAATSAGPKTLAKQAAKATAKGEDSTVVSKAAPKPTKPKKSN